MSGQDFGGIITVRLSTGATLPLRGTLNINPARMSAEAQTNDDGSIDRVGTNEPATAEISFADRGLDYDALMRSKRFNITFIEDFAGVTHYFTDAFMTGKPQLNRKTGEVTGLTVNAPKYNKVNN